MSKCLKSALLRYGITGLVGILLMVMVLGSEDYAHAVTLADRYRILCDAFTVPGAMLLLTGALLLVANAGAFNGIGYALGRLVRVLNPFGNKDDVRYGDYVEQRKTKKHTGFGFIPKTGLAFMAVALVFLALFYQV